MIRQNCKSTSWIVSYDHFSYYSTRKFTLFWYDNSNGCPFSASLCTISVGHSAHLHKRSPYSKIAFGNRITRIALKLCREGGGERRRGCIENKLCPTRIHNFLLSTRANDARATQIWLHIDWSGN